MAYALMTAFIVSGAFAPQQAGSEPLDPVLEARVHRLGKELRCAVCQGLSIADSPSSMARSQLDKVRELVAKGKSDQEIRDYFVARYGDWVLLSPKASGVTWAVWLLPGLFLVAGALIVWRVACRGRDREPPAPGEAPLEDEYLRRVRAEVER